MNDAQLVEACLEGDHRAYAVLVNRYRYPVFGLCLSYVKDFDAAEDAAQEALIAAYLKLESLPEPQKFGPWLRTIAANQCRMWLRRQRRQVAFDEEMAVVDPAPSPAEQVLVRERRQRVLAAVSRLSRPQQQAVVLFYLEGLSLKRIAAFLDVAVPTIEQRALPGAPPPKRGDDNYGQGKPARTPFARGLHAGSSARGTGPGAGTCYRSASGPKPAKPSTASSPPCRTTSKLTAVWPWPSTAKPAKL